MIDEQNECYKTTKKLVDILNELEKTSDKINIVVALLSECILRSSSNSADHLGKILITLNKFTDISLKQVYDGYIDVPDK